MPQHLPFGPIAALMFLTGVGIPVMASFNSALGTQLGSAAGATFVLFAVGLVVSVVIVAVVGFPAREAFSFDRPHLYTGAVFILFYALSITWAAPRIGVGNAVFFVLLGQLVAATAIDHFGLWGALKSAITGRRTAGLVLMAAGVNLARKPA